MISVRHHQGCYPVHFVALDAMLSGLPEESFLITDADVSSLFPSEHPRFVLPPGEASKNIEHYSECLSWLAVAGARRHATIVALGGGVVGDLAGFVAATYMRGVKLLQIPTTLLAQVDSSVGGKVGVDLPEGKNLAGAFMPPVEVRIAVDALRTLPARQFTNGLGEVIKYGAIADGRLFQALEAEQLTPISPNLEQVIERCIRLKAEVVEADEFETNGRRAILNFGHTVGHAVEQVLGYSDLLHGEAVAIGMCVEAQIGETLGITPPGTAARIARVMDSYGLPTQHDCLLRSDALLGAMRRDKKATGRGIAMSLLERIGECKLVEGIPEAQIEMALQP